MLAKLLLSERSAREGKWVKQCAVTKGQLRRATDRIGDSVHRQIVALKSIRDTVLDTPDEIAFMEGYLHAFVGTVLVRQIKYLNNIVEQDHRAVKRVTRSMLGFKSFNAAKCVLAGIELMHMIRKGQFGMKGCEKMSFAEQYYALAGQLRPA